MPALSTSTDRIPARLESYFFVAALSLMSALPFFLGGQPTTLGTADGVRSISAEGDAAKQAIMGLLYAVFGVLLLWRTRLRMLLDLGTPLILLLSLCLISATWSDMPLLALRRSVALAGTVIVGLYAGLRYDVHDMLWLLCRSAAIVLIASFAVAAIYPSLGLDIEGRLRGVFSHKNSFGHFAAFGLLTTLAGAMQASSRRTMTFYALCAAGCLLGLVLARSASPLPAIVVSLAALFWLRRSHAVSHRLVFAVLAAVCAAGLALPMFVDQLGSVASALNRDADFSGRDRIWQFSIELLMRNPWLGYGYDTFWYGPAGTLFLLWSPYLIPAGPGFSWHAHNGYLQLALDTGGIGLALLLCALAVLMIRTDRLLRMEEQSRMSWTVAFMGLYLVSSIPEANLWSQNNLLTMIFVYVVVRTNVLSRAVQYTSCAGSRALNRPRNR